MSATVPNPLEAYLAKTGEKISHVARRMGCSPSTLTRPLSTGRNVSMSIAEKIEEATNGSVKAEEFIAICFAAKRKHLNLPAPVAEARP